MVVDSTSVGIVVCYLKQLPIGNDLITTRHNLEAVEDLSTLIVVDVIRHTSADVFSVKLTLKSSDGNAESERIGIGFVHALSMAHNQAKVKGLWTLIELVDSTHVLRSN